MMCGVNCDGCYAKNHCDVVPNSMNCQEVREDAEKEQRIRADERKKFAIWLDTHGFMRKMDLNISRVDEALYEYGKEHKNAE